MKTISVLRLVSLSSGVVLLVVGLICITVALKIPSPPSSLTLDKVYDWQLAHGAAPELIAAHKAADVFVHLLFILSLFAIGGGILNIAIAIRDFCKEYSGGGTK